MKNILFFVLASLPFINAQSGNSDDTIMSKGASSTASSSAASASSTVHKVDVGEDGFTFNPDTLTVTPGGKVEFHFYPQNHSVAQSSFDNPCHPINDTSFSSGFVPTTKESTTVFTVTINDTRPIWFYCGQIGHCQAGMVGVINPPGSGQDTLDAFKQAAANAKLSTTPATIQGGSLGAVNESPSMSSTASESSGASNTASKTSSTSSPSNAGSQIGTALGMVVVLALSCFVSLSMI